MHFFNTKTNLVAPTEEAPRTAVRACLIEPAIERPQAGGSVGG